MVGIGWLRIMVGAHVCSASLPGTEKSLWEHYNELMAELDAAQVAVWHDMADTTIVFVCSHSLYTFPVAKVQVVRSLRGRPFNIYGLRSPTVKA